VIELKSKENGVEIKPEFESQN